MIMGPRTIAVRRPLHRPSGVFNRRCRQTWRNVTKPIEKTRSGATRMWALSTAGCQGWFTTASGSSLTSRYFIQR